MSLKPLKNFCITLLIGILSFSLISMTLWGEESAPPRGGGSTSKELQRMISQEFQKHNFRKVIALYKDFVTNHPDEYLPLVVLIMYGQSLADVGEIDGSIDVLNTFLNDLPADVNSLKLNYDLANLLFMQRRYEEAKKVYGKILLQFSTYNEILSKTRQRLELMRGREGRKKDVVSLQLLDLETILESGEVPDGAVVFLQEIQLQNQDTPNAERAKELLGKIREIRTKKGRLLLEEARRLFDEEKKYVEVREILEQIMRDYSDVTEKQSVEALMKEVKKRIG